jgi:hypothetical protein
MPLKTLFAALTVLLVGTPAPALAKPFFVEPDDGPDPRGLTLSGSGLARVEPPRRLSAKSIERAVDAVKPVAEARAVRAARRRAVVVARVAGLTLGAVQAVSTRVPDTELFGPHRYCQSARARAGDRARRLRCTVPPFATASIRVTFATDETSAGASTGRAIVGSGSGTAPVRPERQRSPAIRAALRRAQLAADPAALAAALRRATGAARAAGLRRGSLFALAEEPRQPFSQDILSGTFGPGRFCGTIQRVRFIRDPAGGRPRRVRAPRLRRCYLPGVSSVLRVTFAAG